jgi:hypothetical protein
MKLCAESALNAEFSLCGNSFEAPDDPQCDTEPFVIARVGQVVTCDECKRVIREIRETFPRGFKVNPV